MLILILEYFSNSSVQRTTEATGRHGYANINKVFNRRPVRTIRQIPWVDGTPSQRELPSLPQGRGPIFLHNRGAILSRSSDLQPVNSVRLLDSDVDNMHAS